MQIKKFEARTMTEALRKVKKELGSEAVILSARSLDTAKGFMGNIKKRSVEVTAAIDMVVGKSFDESKKPIKKKEEKHRQHDYRDKKKIINTIRGGIQSVTGKIKPLTSENEYIPDNTDFLKIQGELSSHGIKEDIAIELMSHVKKHISLGDDTRINENKIKKCLVELFNAIGIVAGTIKLEHGEKKVIAFAGPTGVGKTSTIAKIATYHSISLKKRVGLITLDNYRIAANARLEVLSNIIGIPLKTASNSQQLIEAVRELKGYDLILIDTPGMSPRDDFKINELKAMLGKAAPDEVHLLLSIVTGEKDLLDIINRFKVIPVDRLIFTKMDESPGYGRMLNRLIKSNIPVSYCTNGQQIPENIEEITAERLVDMILPMKSNIERTEITEKEIGSEKKRSDVNSFNNATVKYAGKTETVVPSSTSYVANKNSDIFHYYNCKWTKMIKKENMLVFESETEAKSSSFKPCRSCCPGIGENQHSYVAIAGRGGDKIAGYR